MKAGHESNELCCCYCNDVKLIKSNALSEKPYNQILNNKQS